MQPQLGYSGPPDMSCPLCRSLYGLKQAPRARFERFNSMVTALVFWGVLRILRCLSAFLLVVGLFYMLMA